jgi:hypothetical protein
MLSGKLVTIHDVSADRRCRSLLGSVDPAREMFLDPRCHSPLSASDVTASTVTEKVIDNVGLAEGGNGILERSNGNAPGGEHKTGS